MFYGADDFNVIPYDGHEGMSDPNYVRVHYVVETFDRRQKNLRLKFSSDIIDKLRIVR